MAGCAAVRPVTDMAAGAGGGYIADKLSNGNPAITAAGAAGGVLLSEGGFYLAGKESDKAYTTCLLYTSNQRLQIQYYCDSDYRHELLRYNAETQKAANVWTRRSRNERFERYWRLMTERRLRRQRLVFYLSRKIETSSKGIKSAAFLTEYYNQILGQFKSEFEHTHEMLTDIFAGQGARIIPMKDADHFRHCKTFLNPSLAERFDYDPIDGFDPKLSIQENCWHSEGAGQADFGFFMDGRYHSIIASVSYTHLYQ